jgi:hypothetical protein
MRVISSNIADFILKELGTEIAVVTLLQWNFAVVTNKRWFGVN